MFVMAREPPVLSGPNKSLRELIARVYRDAASAHGASPSTPPISVTHIDAATLLEEAATTVSADEREHAMRLYRKADRQTYIFAHAILRLLLSLRLETDPRRIQFGCGKSGKPALVFPRRGLHFNISHADRTIAIGIAGNPIGIDIDAARDDIDVEGIGGQFFTAEEQIYLKAASPEEQKERFFYLWTRKEALVKAAGTGLDAIASVSVLDGNVKMADESGFMGEYSLHTLSPPSGYSLALALQTGK